MSRSTSSSTTLNFKIDESVRCKFASASYPAKILNIDNSGGSVSYLIHYQNWNKRYDEWVPAGRLSKIKASSTATVKKSVAAQPKNKFLKKIVDNVKTPKTSTPISAKASKKNEKSIQLSNSRSKIVIESPSPIKKSSALIKLRPKKETKSVNLPKPSLERIVEDDLVVYKTSNGRRFLTLDEIEQYCKGRKFDFQESDYNFLIPPPPSKKNKIGKKIYVVKKSTSPRLKKQKSSSTTPNDNLSTPMLGKRLRKLNKKYATTPIEQETPSKNKNRVKKLGRPLLTPKKTSPKSKKVEKSPTKKPQPAKPLPSSVDVSKKKRKPPKDVVPIKSKKQKLVEKSVTSNIKLTKNESKKRAKKKKLAIIPAPLMEQPVECVEVQETGIGQIGSPIDERLPNLNSTMKILLDKDQQRKKTFSESSTSKLPDMADTQHKGFSLGLYQSATSKLYAQQTQMKSGVYVQLPKPKGFTLSPSTSPPIVAVAAKRNFQQQPMRYDEHGLPIITDAEIEEGLRNVDTFKYSTTNSIGALRTEASLMAAFSAAESLSGGGQRSMAAASRRGGQRSLSGGWSSGCGGGGESSDFNASQRRRVARVSPHGVDNVESMEGDFSIVMG
uniref:Chromo domain-containing protein n=1 Tax=Romanomermis culicivorax TaxID=13658 RepID=A0A915L397_ROMCU